MQIKKQWLFMMWIIWVTVDAALLKGDSTLAAIQRLEPLAPILIGASGWGRDDYFKLKWQYHAENPIIASDIVPSRKEIWITTDPRGLEDKSEFISLDSHGELLRKFTLQVRVKDFHILDAKGSYFPFAWRKREPKAVVLDNLYVSLYDLGGERQWNFSYPSVSPRSLAIIPKDSGGPLIVVGHDYGGTGLAAIGMDGKLKWESKEIERADNVRMAQVDGQAVITADNGVGRIYLVDPKGKLIERIEAGGNTERILFDRRNSEQWMYGFDSSAGSWREKLNLYQRKGKKGPWELVSSIDLGHITVTADALGDFDGNGNRHLVVGTENGWVFVLNRSGNVISEARFRGKVQFLGAMDLNNDHKEELIVCIQGPSGGVFAFTRPTEGSGQ